MSLVDLGKQLLEAAKLGQTDQVRALMAGGAPFTTDWVFVINQYYMWSLSESYLTVNQPYQ